MSSEPRIEERAEQPYVAIRGLVTMQTIGAIADRLPEVFTWLAERDIPPAGAPFFRYNVIDMRQQLEIEVGAPLTIAVEGSGDVIAGTLPAGRYAVVSHVGHPDKLMGVTRNLLEWADEQGVRWDMAETGVGQRWGCRLENYRTDPREEPDLNKWETELAFRVAD
jgi:effector-binding domain-containing protein